MLECQNVFILSVGRNWTFFLKMCLKLEFIICFRCTQYTRRLAITKFLSKIIEQRLKLGTFVKIISNFSKFMSGKNCSRLLVSVQILWKHFSETIFSFYHFRILIKKLFQLIWTIYCVVFPGKKNRLSRM